MGEFFDFSGVIVRSTSSFRSTMEANFARKAVVFHFFVSCFALTISF